MESGLQFSCNFCPSGEQLTDMEQLEHIRTDHLDYYKPYKCEECREKYAVEPKFRKHAIKKHGSESMIANSSNCSQYLNVLGDMMMQCSFYNAIGNKQTPTKLINTIKQCTIEQFPTLNSLEQSLLNCTSNQAQTSADRKKIRPSCKSIAELACEFCPRTFSRLSILNVHQDGSHNKVSRGINKCDKCDKRFHNHSNLLRHMYQGHKIREPENVELRERAPSHKIPPKIVSSIKPHKLSKCQHCPVTFDRISEWRRHQDNKHRTISNGPYKCRDCHKRYYSYSNFLRCHPDSHKIAQTLECQLNVHQLQAHQDNEHQRNLFENLSQKPLPRKLRKAKAPLHCLECKRSVYGTAAYHLATFHIKKELVKCSECDYSNYWNSANARRHIDTAHNGNSHVIDQRESIAGEIEQLTSEIIRKKVGNPLQVKAKAPSMNNRIITSRKRAIKQQKWAHCSQCKFSMDVYSVRGHVAAKHIGKHSLRCEGCQFSTHWHAKTMKLHLRTHHAGENIGFVDKRHEIEDEVIKLIEQCITFHQKN